MAGEVMHIVDSGTITGGWPTAVGEIATPSKAIPLSEAKLSDVTASIVRGDQQTGQSTPRR